MGLEVRDNPKDFNCQECKLEHFCDKECEWPGSIGDAGYALIEVKRNGYHFESSTCLLPQLTERTRNFFKLHRHYQQGNLLVEGGLYDQPNVYLVAMEIIDA